MNDRKMTVLRLVIFCVLAFVPFWIILPAMNAHFGEPVYMSEAAQPAVYALGLFGMLIPSVAHLITRLVTGEGFRNTYLGVNIRGNGKWYLASVWVKLAESAIGALLIWRLFAGELSFREAFPLDDPKALTGMLLLQLAFTLVVFFPAFGEEWGWRGYMMPKLLQLMPKWAAVLLGGVLWGLWHAPLTVAGHNFGVDYVGYPWVGIGEMCLMCVLINAFLTLLTERTKSIYPASFCHMVSNNIGSEVLILLAGSDALTTAVDQSQGSTFFSTYVPLLLITAVISMMLLRKPNAEITS
ncbi:MAG: CPBP family intramembrane metalloprotease [Oscillospiraceae bacterium]|nr:CPBP family intramembrane metalloprotease [Oscillospiraceae bacterium]